MVHPDTTPAVGRALSVARHRTFDVPFSPLRTRLAEIHSLLCTENAIDSRRACVHLYNLLRELNAEEVPRT